MPAPSPYLASTEPQCSCSVPGCHQLQPPPPAAQNMPNIGRQQPAVRRLTLSANARTWSYQGDPPSGPPPIRAELTSDQPTTGLRPTSLNQPAAWLRTSREMVPGSGHKILGQFLQTNKMRSRELAGMLAAPRCTGWQ